MYAAANLCCWAHNLPLLLPSPGLHTWCHVRQSILFELPQHTHLTVYAVTDCLQDARATCANTNTNVTANGTVSSVVPFACPNGFALTSNASNITNVTAASCCVSCYVSLAGTRCSCKLLLAQQATADCIQHESAQHKRSCSQCRLQLEGLCSCVPQLWTHLCPCAY
jgi:hypothetical protein